MLSGSAKPRCMRKGPITANGYLNFLRDYRQKCCGMTAVETVRRGAKAWNRLTCQQKAKYRRMGCKRTKHSKKKKKSRSHKSRLRKHKGGSKGRHKSKKARKSHKSAHKSAHRSAHRSAHKSARKCSRKGRSRPKHKKGKSKSKKHCMRPGPITNNGYLNFLRWFRTTKCGLKPNEAIRLGARKWCSLPQNKKDVFRKMACKVTTSQRRKRTRLCRGA